MITTNILNNTEMRRVFEQKGRFSVIGSIQHRDVGYNPEFFDPTVGGVNIAKRQLVYNLDGSCGLIVQAGAMHMMMGNINAATDVKGAGDLVRKAFASKATGETAIKPKYTGNGTFVFEATSKHIILLDVGEWQNGIVLEDGLFLAAEDTLNLNVVSRTTLSSAALGGEGLFNTCISGHGICALESRVPKSELITVVLDNDTLKIDGSHAIAWSNSLQFTVEKTTKSLIGSAASGEGLVNVYRGTGKVLIAPTCYSF